MIAYQRESAAGELDPDLVAAASMEPDADQTFFTGCQTGKFQSGFFDPAPLAFYHKDLILFAVFPE